MSDNLVIDIHQLLHKNPRRPETLSLSEIVQIRASKRGADQVWWQAVYMPWLAALPWYRRLWRQLLMRRLI